MTVYLVNIALIAMWSYVFVAPKKKLTMANPEKYFCAFAALQWILVSGLRGLSIGADTIAYYNAFNRVKSRSWERIWSDFVAGVFKGEEIKDPGYVLLEKIFQIFSDEYRMWLIFIAVVFTVPMAIWIYKKSSNVFMSFLIYSCLFYSFFAITGHRQTIATGVVVFVGDFLIKKRKFVPFLLITLIMSTVHKSCLIFILLYFLYNKKVTITYICTMAVMAVVAFAFKDQITLFLASASGYDSYEIYEGAGTYTFTALMIMITAASLWRRKYILEQNIESRSFYNALLLAMVFIPMTFVNPNTMRIVQYFSVYIMLMVPEIINSFEKRDKAIATVVAGVVLVFFFIRNNPQYMFFWE